MKLIGRIIRAVANSGGLDVGVRNNADAKHRKARIQELILTMEDQSAENIEAVKEFMDQWVIFKASSGYIATPGWDDEPLLTRNAYSTYEDACTAVASVGGTLRTGRRAA